MLYSKKTSRKNIVIAGAGLAGLSVAWHLQKKGVNCRIFEKEGQAGGLCRSAHVRGFTFDICGHLLHFRHRHTFEMVQAMLGQELVGHKKSAWIYSHNRFTRYPFQGNLYGLPKPVIKECLLGLVKARRNGHQKDLSRLSFLDWINQTFGKGIAEHFMIPYNKKFWTVEPEELNCDWFDGFIPVPSLQDVIERTIEESRMPVGYNATFWYPKKGGIERLARHLVSGVKGIQTRHQIARIDIKNKKLYFTNGKTCSYGTLILTIPLPELLELVYELPSGVARALKQLRYNSIYNLNIGLNGPEDSGRHWVYFPEEKFIFFRAGFPASFSAGACPKGRSSAYIEVSYGAGRMLDKNTLAGRIKNDLLRSGITGGRKIIAENVNDIEYGYVIYDRNRYPALRKINAFLKRNDIQGLGRYGSWSYKSMEDVLLDGKKLADSL